MLARDLIKDTIPPLKSSDTGLRALNWMEEFRVNHLPIVENVNYLSLISEDDILRINSPQESLKNYIIIPFRPFVREYQHVSDVIKLIAQLKLSIVPVLDDQENYLGAISLPDLVQHIGEIISVQDPGGVIVISLNLNDYSLSKIAHIVESNDAIILNSYITSDPSDHKKLDLTLKINKTDLSRILATFYRYNYEVKASYHQSEFTDNLKSRYDSFMNYLNM